jgi:hypothetical protein
MRVGVGPLRGSSWVLIIPKVLVKATNVRRDMIVTQNALILSSRARSRFWFGGGGGDNGLPASGSNILADRIRSQPLFW